MNSALGLDQTKPGIKYFRANSTGEDAAAAGKDAVAIGVSAKANGKDSVALGDDARSALSAENSIAIGRKAVSGSFNDMTADGDSSTVVIGGGKSSISIGDAANAQGNSSIALGMERPCIMTEPMLSLIVTAWQSGLRPVRLLPTMQSLWEITLL